MKLKVIYRDSSVLAVHKPIGMATYSESRDQGAGGCKELLEEQLNERLFPVHRIDADTSGVVLFALDTRSASAFIRLFKFQEVYKTYLAWCEGQIPEDGSIRTALKKNKSEQSESARTDYQRVQMKGGRSLVRIYPHTGRFHQIRRHFHSIGHPLVGDPIYNPAAKEFAKAHPTKAPRLMLLAEAVDFIHPNTGRNVIIKTKSDL
jgi:tRNA pseudouridine65 synthase